MARPEILFPLFADVTSLSGVGPKIGEAMAKLGLSSVRDILFHLPSSAIDRRLRHDVRRVLDGETITVEIRVLEHAPGRTDRQPYRVFVEGGMTGFELVFFRARRDWIEKLLPVGQTRLVSGRVEIFDGRLQMAHPDHVLPLRDTGALPDFEPVYPLSQGISQKLMHKAAGQALDLLPGFEEWHRSDLVEAGNWPTFSDALRSFHRPSQSAADRRDDPARTRLAYDELLSHQLALALVRARMRRGAGQSNTGDGTLRAAAEQAFGFSPTGAQRRAIEEISADMSSSERMLRLLQGDVGSGKTWVAMMAMLIAVEGGGQAALMAPTEILARQHAEGLGGIASALGLELVMLSGRDKGAARSDKLARISDGRAQIVVGTHALFQPSVVFGALRLAVIDEQHRFGVRQRLDLAAKAPKGADVLVMTATPIPRTLALTGYGDLDFSILDEKPPGRLPVDTRTMSRERYPDVVARLGHALDEGSRCYWVCPAVELTESGAFVSAEDRYGQISKSLGAHRVGLVHGQMAPEEKDAAMRAFQDGKIQILVATTVIEVGVDVPEATIMVIEQADVFGLSQLH
ncbi:MAG: ATP-dependent DNA helicase RecG, partial [Pseudomonadota bacterium]